ncbi:uncharacterized protein N7482_006514 [Penicillium canariense]|uniref:Glycosyltransferase family 28 N-terminal domain-containing protein n=1 Tax=Penicillium canariense TaxID=189055 RepID=A0A9W9HXH0_9EURO|nr:uncharacterized protein N7482_006514 [Penicillium canariense]KAJ5159510.1 hypothetical protein N7482_006514 [Penicillium canariense]
MSTFAPTLTVPGESGGSEVGQVVIARKHSTASAFVRPDGRVDVQVADEPTTLAKNLQKWLNRQLHVPRGDDATGAQDGAATNASWTLGPSATVPRLNIAIHIVGSRGDVQPFIAIAKVLSQPPYSHRVRICTHPVFKNFVESNGLEFFSIGGDPATLMAYMVKNPGLMPGKESWKSGEVGKRRAEIAQILEGCWRSCIEPGNGMDGGQEGSGAGSHFVADAIIANPPSYAHLHCAEKLRIPLHMVFTMPWSPTQYFPHPLAAIERSKSDPSFANYMSYTLMELLAWEGLGDVINGFRMKTLHLDAISPLWGHMLLSRRKVPFTYTWSSALIPKPPDWGSHINISAFSFLSAPSSYQPPDALAEFLKAGPPPVYIGFGSIVVEKPKELTDIVFGAVKRLGIRALVSQGWGGLGGEEAPEGVFLLGDCPHDWLFQYVSCVVHHGGAGTTAIGIAMGKPTVIVPFFGDQPFWGAMIYRAGAGPEPVPYKKLTAEILAENISKALGSDIERAVGEMSAKIAQENGAVDTAMAFHKSLDLDAMSCQLCPSKVAICRVRRTKLRLSALAAATLVEHGHLTFHDCRPINHKTWDVDEGPVGPVTGAIASITGTITGTVVNTSRYSRKMSRSRRKKLEEKDAQSIISEAEGPAPLGVETPPDIANHFSFSSAGKYPPEYLEQVAHQMATRKLPSRTSRSKHRARHPWSPITRPETMASMASKSSNKSTQQGGVHGATYETGQYALSLIGTGLKAPVALLYNLANGFHNSPALIFHDNTVRHRKSITGLASGIKVAAHGFTLNLFDGVTGIVTQPYHGAQDDGVSGFGKGVVKGLGGMVLRTTAAVIGVPAYTLKGLERQIEERFDHDLRAKILTTRLRQAIAAYEQGSTQEKEDILSKWKSYGYK